MIRLPMLITSLCVLAVSAMTTLSKPESPTSTATATAPEPTSTSDTTLTAAAPSPTGEATTNAANPVSAPVQGTPISSGASFTIQWLPTAGKTVTLVLRKGQDKSLDIVEVIADNLPNSGVFIWVPSTQLAGGSDYAIEITSNDPPTSNYSAQFTINSNGPGIKGKPIEPSTTRSVSIPQKTNVPKYTGTEAAPAKATDAATASSGASSSGSTPPTGTASGGFGGLGKCIVTVVAICGFMIIL